MAMGVSVVPHVSQKFLEKIIGKRSTSARPSRGSGGYRDTERRDWGQHRHNELEDMNEGRRFSRRFDEPAARKWKKQRWQGRGRRS